MNAYKLIWRPWFKKLCLLILMFLFVGWPQSCWQFHKERKQAEEVEKSQRQKMLPLEELNRERAMEKYVEAKILSVKQKIAQGGTYSATDYYNDLKEKDIKIKELGIGDKTSYHLYPALWDICQKNLKTKKDYDAMEAAKENYKESIDPGGKARKKAFTDLKTLGWIGILTWLFFLYLKIMPFAFGLFLIWANENQEKQQFLFPSPLRFLLMLICYPLVVGYVFIKWMKKKEYEYLAEAEYRRTKQNLFTYLTPEEIKRIKKFSESTLSLRSWREQLIASGLSPQHGLAIALVATLLISFIPNSVQAESKIKVKNCLSGIASKQIIWQYSSRNCIDNAHLQKMNNGQSWQDGAAKIETNNFKPNLIVHWFKWREVIWRKQKVYNKINHIPIFGYSV